MVFWPGAGSRKLAAVGADEGGGSDFPTGLEITAADPDFAFPESSAEETPFEDQLATLPEMPAVHVSPTDFVMAVDPDKRQVKLDLPMTRIRVAPTTASLRPGGGGYPGEGFPDRPGRRGARMFIDGRTIATAMPPPFYPETARRDGREGSVELYVAIAGNGHAARVEVLSTSGSRDLDAAARKIVSERWRFQPPKDSSATECRVKVSFRLTERGLAMNR